MEHPDALCWPNCFTAEKQYKCNLVNRWTISQNTLGRQTKTAGYNRLCESFRRLYSNGRYGQVTSLMLVISPAYCDYYQSGTCTYSNN